MKKLLLLSACITVLLSQICAYGTDVTYTPVDSANETFAPVSGLQKTFAVIDNNNEKFLLTSVLAYSKGNPLYYGLSLSHMPDNNSLTQVGGYRIEALAFTVDSATSLIYVIDTNGSTHIYRAYTVPNVAPEANILADLTEETAASQPFFQDDQEQGTIYRNIVPEGNISPGLISRNPGLGSLAVLLGGWLFYGRENTLTCLNKNVDKSDCSYKVFSSDTQRITNISAVNEPNGSQKLFVLGLNGEYKVFEWNRAKLQLKEVGQGTVPDFYGAANFIVTPLGEDFNRKIVLTYVKDQAVKWADLSVESSDNSIDWNSLTTGGVLATNDREYGAVLQYLLPEDREINGSIVDRPQQAGSQELIIIKAAILIEAFPFVSYLDSFFSGYLWYKANQTVDIGEAYRVNSDNIIGVAYGPPPCQPGTTRSFFTLGRRVSQEKVETNGYDTSTQISFGGTSKSAFQEGSAWVGLYANYAYNALSSARIEIGGNNDYGYTSASSNAGSSSIETGTGTIDDPWTGDVGYIFVERGYDRYNVFKLTPIADYDSSYVDQNNSTVINMAVAPYKFEQPYMSYVTFKLSSPAGTDPIILNSSEDTDHVKNPAVVYDNFTGYTEGMLTTGVNSFVYGNNFTNSFWNADNNIDSASYYIDESINAGAVHYKTNTNILINNASRSQANITFDRSKEESNQFGTGINFDLEVKGGLEKLRIGAKFSSKFGFTAGNQTKLGERANFGFGAWETVNMQSPNMEVQAHLLLPGKKQKVKPFWCPQWAWEKGNRPWCIIYTVRANPHARSL
ncbi:hypothetical protein P0136_07745 [Lentisphaerota bacterium ZTH]|nr:hypothetical protein JYG24_01140 [Lentisphaerota bacterium]WET05258.1 hypothetical protein P0136_07745 [Lentisphaerota bacterium ZTH]